MRGFGRLSDHLAPSSPVFAKQMEPERAEVLNGFLKESSEYNSNSPHSGENNRQWLGRKLASI